MKLNKLDTIINQKGFVYTQVEKSDSGYVYEQKNKGSDTIIGYEVFEKRSAPVCLDFENRIYSDTEFKETFPKDNDFGVWAWSYRTLERSIEKLNQLKQ